MAENRALRHILEMMDPCIHEQMDTALRAYVEGRTMTVMEYLESRGIVTLAKSVDLG